MYAACKRSVDVLVLRVSHDGIIQGEIDYWDPRNTRKFFKVTKDLKIPRLLGYLKKNSIILRFCCKNHEWRLKCAL